MGTKELRLDGIQAMLRSTGYEVRKPKKCQDNFRVVIFLKYQPIFIIFPVGDPKYIPIGILNLGDHTLCYNRRFKQRMLAIKREIEQEYGIRLTVHEHQC